MNQIVLTINFSEVVEIIKQNSDRELITRKADILNGLHIEDTKENRKLLDKAIKHLKDKNLIYTTYAICWGEPGYRGRGYMYNDSEDQDAEN